MKRYFYFLGAALFAFCPLNVRAQGRLTFASYVRENIRILSKFNKALPKIAFQDIQPQRAVASTDKPKPVASQNKKDADQKTPPKDSSDLWSGDPFSQTP